MRTINVNSGQYTATIKTTDKICEAFGKCYLIVNFTSLAVIPNKVKVVYDNLQFEMPVKIESVEEIYASFNLSWFRYIAPKFGTKKITLDIEFDDTLVYSMEYELMAGHGEIDMSREIFSNYYINDITLICPTQKTGNWQKCEVLIKKAPQEITLKNGVFGKKYSVGGQEITDIGIVEVDTSEKNNVGVSITYEGATITILLKKIDIIDATCADIELRITNRHGLRGAIGGKLIDVSEGGDDVKSNFNKVTPYAGIYEWSKKGATIKKEVGFNFEGDEGLLGLLRDGCVYGRVEWYDERTEQWLPCRIEEKSIGNNAWDEQIVTIVLQEL